MTCTKVYIYGKWTCRKETLFHVCLGHGYPWISIYTLLYICLDIRLRTATEVIRPISDIRIINDFTISVCIEDADVVTEDVLCFLFLVLFVFLAEFTLASPLWK